jgi:hypothetical protein
LVDKAQAIAVFPGVLKAAFIFGGREGKGVISRRTAQGWTTPAFFNLGGGSFGAQIGADKTDYVLLIMNDKGLNGLLGDKFQIGGEVGVAAGPVGREASAATDAQLKAERTLVCRALRQHDETTELTVTNVYSERNTQPHLTEVRRTLRLHYERYVAESKSRGRRVK